MKMATFAMCQSKSGQIFFVNVDSVRMVEQVASGNESKVTFTDGSVIYIAGVPAVITMAGKERNL
jgi:hypothetical protein